ncbi:MAG TPA: MBL fold metallo-hydrolase [bacterium]|nr:MBL fold metallo-hydrolase [bacterium]
MANVRTQLGDIELVSLDAGRFPYDGGAMFGGVPKVIWGNLTPVDEFNRIILTLSPLLIRSGGLNFVVDVGYGSRHTKKDLKIWGFDPEVTVVTALADEGLAPSDIDTVILTHLHADHAAGSTSDGEGSVVPTFPNARYIANRTEWEAANDPDDRSRAAYRPDDFVPLMEAGVLDLVGDSHDLGDGVSVGRTGGHTAGHLAVYVESGGRKAVYPADLIPTRNHVRVPYIAGIDLIPLEVIESKKRMLEAAVAEDWIVILDHDVFGNIGRIVKDEKGRFAFKDIGA